jgi:murein DD-endopeptidase MepM/ murein hydrolase activator NlpD
LFIIFAVLADKIFENEACPIQLFSHRKVLNQITMPEKQDSNNKKQQKKPLPWLSGYHRLVLVNDKTFLEEKSWNLNLKNLLIISALVFFSIFIFILLLLRFTPLNSLVSTGPRISDNAMRKEMEKLYRELDSLDRALEGNITYIESLKKLSSESFEYEKDAKKAEPSVKKENSNTIAEASKKTEGSSKTNNGTSSQTAEGNLIQSEFLDKRSKSDRGNFLSPLRGVVSDRFAPSRGHFGTDIVAPKGTVVKAAKGGTVIMSSWSSDTGHMIGIQHDGNLVSWYKHNSANLKKLGDRVSAGDAIAIIGNSGEMSNGPHLHFELWYNGQPVDAEKYINF